MDDPGPGRRGLFDLDGAELRFFWRVLWVATPAYALTGALVRSGPAASPPGSAQMAAAWLAAGACTAAFLAVRPLLARRAPYGLRCLARWGLAEAVAFAGFLLYVAGGGAGSFFTLLAWSLALHALSPPAVREDGAPP